MKKLVCILLILCMLMSAVSVLAVTPVLDSKTPMATIRIDGKDSTYFYYDSETGNINTAKTTTATGLGDLIMPEKVNADYAFTTTTGENVYHYQVLDEITVNGEQQYYIYCNDIYGYNIGVTPVNNVFDPDVENNIAHWLNNQFYNGASATNEGVVIDTAIKPYIENHDYIVEANSSAPDGYPKTDYSVNCKISLLSISEYAKYSKKIGWGAYLKGSLTSNGIHMFLRSPAANTTSLRTLYAQNGCTANVAVYNAVSTKFTSGYGAARIRPAFYVSQKYFENVKLDLTTAGSEVKKIISDLKPGIYSEDELLALKGIYTLTEDGSKALSPDEWTLKVTPTIETVGTSDTALSFKNGWIARKLPSNIKGGTVTIETQVYEVTGNGLYIGFMYEGDSSPNYKYPLYISNSKVMNYYNKTPEDGNVSAPYKRLDNNDYDLSSAHFKFPQTWKLTVNLDTGNCYASISGTPDGKANTTDKIRYSLGTTSVSSYVDSDKTFSKIAFWSNDTSNLTKINNIKITYDPNGNAIKSVEKTGDKEIKITVEDYVDLKDVTKDSICLTANSVSAISKDENTITATLTNKLTDGNTCCVIVNDMKRNDVGSANYTIIGNSKVFTVKTPTETVIGAPVISGNLTSGSTVSVASAVTKGTLTDVKPVQFAIAAYNGDRLIGAKIVSVADVNTAAELKAEITLSENATEVRAFIWDAKNYPICSAVSKNK